MCDLYEDGNQEYLARTYLRSESVEASPAAEYEVQN